jgi:hypothetical protein
MWASWSIAKFQWRKLSREVDWCPNYLFPLGCAQHDTITSCATGQGHILTLREINGDIGSTCPACSLLQCGILVSGHKILFAFSQGIHPTIHRNREIFNECARWKWICIFLPGTRLPNKHPVTAQSCLAAHMKCETSSKRAFWFVWQQPQNASCFFPLLKKIVWKVMIWHKLHSILPFAQANCADPNPTKCFTSSPW